MTLPVAPKPTVYHTVTVNSLHRFRGWWVSCDDVWHQIQGSRPYGRQYQVLTDGPTLDYDGPLSTATITDRNPYT